MEERLQKILAHAGVASRRKAEELISQGKVELNGKVVRELGTKADVKKDIIRVNGSLIAEPEDKVWYVLYKPAGCVTTLSDPEDRPTIARYLGAIKERVYPVGRLDYDVEGSLLITNDGELAHELMHPRFGVRRTYLAKVSGVPEPEQIAKLTQGVRLEDGRAKALEAELYSRTPRNSWVRLVVAEGRPHLVKRLMEAVGAPVIKLYRADYGGVGVSGMKPGEVRELTRAELEMLRSHPQRVAEDGKKGTAARKGSSAAKAGGATAKAKAGAALSGPRTPITLPARRHGHGPPAPMGRGRGRGGAKSRGPRGGVRRK